MGLLGKTVVGEMGLLCKFLDQMGVDQMGCYHTEMHKILVLQSLTDFYFRHVCSSCLTP